MHVFIADLHKDGTGLGEELAGREQAVAQIGEVGMDAELPSVAEGADLFGLAGEVCGAAIDHIAFVHAELPVRAEFDAVGRVDVDHLHAPFEAFFFCQTGHNEERVAQNQAVGPMRLAFRVVAVKIEFALKFGIFQAIEIVEKVELVIGGFFNASACGSAKIFDNGLGMDFFLNVDRHNRHGEVFGILFVFALPHQLRVERRVAPIQFGLGAAFVIGHKIAQFFGWDICTPISVFNRVNGICGRCLFFRHGSDLWLRGLIGYPMRCTLGFGGQCE